MRAARPLEAIAAAAARRPLRALVAVAVLALLGGALALGLRASAETDTLVSRSSPAYRASQDYHRRFGDDPIYVLIEEKLGDLLGGRHELARELALEDCLSGTVRKGAKPLGGACAELARTKPVQVVYGPGTFLAQAADALVGQVRTKLAAVQSEAQAAGDAAAAAAQKRGASGARAQQAGQAAAQAVYLQAVGQNQQYVQALNRFQGPPTIDNALFVNQVVFDPLRGSSVPKAKFAYLFPSPAAALIQVRLRPGLSGVQRTRAIAVIRRAVALVRPVDFSASVARRPLGTAYGGRYTVSGVPVVTNDLAGSITSSLRVLLLVALLVMAGTLALVFKARLRLLPLAIALATSAMTFGLMRVLGAQLTMASIAVLPVLIGLAVDYAVQLHARVREQGDVVAAARVGAPAVATAALATAAGFLALMLSPVPMVRSFGLMLVLGIAIGFACALVAGSAALALAAEPELAGRLAPSLRGAALLGDARALVSGLARAPAGLRARSARAAGRTRARGAGAIGAAARRPERVLAVGLALAALGWALDTQTAVQSDVRKLVPQDLPALRAVNELERVTHSSGELDVTVEAADVSAAPVVRWMVAYQQRMLARFDYSEARGCGRATLCPAVSLPDLLAAGGGKVDSRTVRDLLAVLPPYFSRAVVSGDGAGHYTHATLAFGIRLMSLEKQEQVIDAMRAALHPPAGIHVRLAGLPVLAADANASLADPLRRLLTLLASLALVALALFAVLRDRRRAIVPLAPILLATGWSSLLLFALGVPLNPMSATLGALVVAISTEFSVLLCERYRQERDAGHERGTALARTYASTGAAVLVSGTTAILGFAVLGASSIAMLRDFALATVIDLSVSLAGVLLVLPAVLAISEDGVRVRLRPPARRRRLPA